LPHDAVRRLVASEIAAGGVILAAFAALEPEGVPFPLREARDEDTYKISYAIVRKCFVLSYFTEPAVSSTH
jgi:hypothetical protein